MCGQTVYYDVFENMGDHTAGGLLTSSQLGNGESHEVNYGTENLGVVIKASYTDGPQNGEVLQFEVTKDNNRQVINHDISAVNGDPFLADGSSMYVDDPNGTCNNIQCQPGDDSCAFQFPEDNGKDQECAGIEHIVYAQVCDVV